MSSSSIFTASESFPYAQYAEDSRQLEEFRTCDFSSMAEELKKIMPGATNLQLEPVALAQHVGHELGRPYIRSPRRTFIGGTGAGDVADLYEDLRIDDMLAEQSQVEALQQQLLFLPVPARGGRHRLLAFRPGEYRPEWGDPLETDVRYADKLEVRVPIRARDNLMLFGRLVITPTEAYVEGDAKSERVGLFEAWGHGTSNPLGYIPGHIVRSVAPPRGWPHGPIAQDVLAMQIAIVIALTDLELTCRFQGHGRETLIGPGAKLSAAGAAKVRVGASTMLAFDEAEPNTLRHELTSPQPMIDRVIMAINLSLTLLQRFRSLGAGDSTAITGAGKRWERVDELEQQYRVERRWRTAEQRIAEILTDSLSLKGGRIGGYKPPKVQVDYQYVEPVENDLQTTQASILRYLTGVDSPGELVARRDNLDLDDAWKVVRDRMEANKEFLQGLSSRDVPGLDSVAGAVGDAQNRGAAA